MTELRWILLAAGIVLILGIYFWGRRERGREPGPELARPPRFESPPPPAPVESARLEPQVTFGSVVAPREVVPVIRLDDEPVGADAPSSGRREPTLGPAAADHEAPAVQAEPAPAARPTRQSQKIFSVRVGAPLPARFDGAGLLEALKAESMTHGRYSIFHRLDPSGRPIFSIASVVEPGTFDPASMPGSAFPGIAFFTVIPGPVKAQEAFDSMLLCADAIAKRLDGHLQDDRGVRLTLPRVAQLREELLAFERSRAEAGKG
jgi:cell division protein ZipA